jgi:hypothetical protein
MTQLLSSSGQCLPNFQPPDLVQFAWALAQLSYQPDALWLSSLWAASWRCLGEFQVGELTTMVRALVKLRVVVDQWWLEELAVVVVRRLGEFDGRGLMVALQGLVLLRRAAAAATAASEREQAAAAGGGGLQGGVLEVLEARLWGKDAMLGRGGFRGVAVQHEDVAGGGWLRVQGGGYLCSQYHLQQQEQVWKEQGWGLAASASGRVKEDQWVSERFGLMGGGGRQGLVVQPVHGQFDLEWHHLASCCEGQLDGEQRGASLQQQGRAHKLTGQWVVRGNVGGAEGVYRKHGSNSQSSSRGESSFTGGLKRDITAGEGGRLGLLEDVLTDIYGIACLTMLLPSWRGSHLKEWPLLAAAQGQYIRFLEVGQANSAQEVNRRSVGSHMVISAGAVHG